jgi:hypothetical protein
MSFHSRKVLFLVLGLSYLCVTDIFAQVDTAWVRRYNGPADSTDSPAAIAVDHSGNVYVTGLSYGIGTQLDYATVKYYSNGDTAWVRRYNGPGNMDDLAWAVAVDDSDNVYVTGRSWSSEEGNDYATIKYFSNGDTAWVRRYASPDITWDEAKCVIVDDSGYVYVSGNSSGWATIKYYPNGDTVWLRRYGFGNMAAVVVDKSGNIYETGRSENGADYLTAKCYANGDTAWVRRYNGPGNSWDYAYAIAVDDSGNIYVAGSVTISESEQDYGTIKYYPDGDTAWIRTYKGPTGWNEAYAVALDDSGYVYVTGNSSTDYATIKYYPTGDTVWVRRYNGPAGSSDFARAIVVDKFKNVYVSGYSWGSGTGADFATIKYYPNGNTAWVMRYNGPANGSDAIQFQNQLAMDDSGYVYVTGDSYGIGTNIDYATIKYVQSPSGVEDETQVLEKPSEFSLSQNYPNPFNPSTTIHFTVHRPSSAVRSPVLTTLVVYNVLGETVKTLLSEPKEAGEYTIRWDGKNDRGEQLSSGVYFYELKVGDQPSVKKMVLLK